MLEQLVSLRLAMYPLLECAFLGAVKFTIKLVAWSLFQVIGYEKKCRSEGCQGYRRSEDPPRSIYSN